MSLNAKVCPKCKNLCKLEDFSCEACGETLESNPYKKVNKALLDDEQAVKQIKKEDLGHKSNFHDTNIPDPTKGRLLFAGFYAWFIASLTILIFNLNMTQAASLFFITSLSDASLIVSNSNEIDIATKILFVAICSIFAGYIARKKGVIAGLISISIPFVIGTPLRLWQAGIISNEILIDGLLLVLFGMIGGYIGQAIYRKETDRDIENIKTTLFGIRWYHIIWITLVMLPIWLVSIVYILTSFSIFTYDLFMFIYYVFGNPLRLFEHLIDLTRFLTMGVILGILPLIAASYVISFFFKTLQYRNVTQSVQQKALFAVLSGLIAPVALGFLCFKTSSWIWLNVEITTGIPVFGYITILILLVLGIKKINTVR